MDDVAFDTRIRNLRPGTGGAAFLVNLLNPAAHNMHHFRVGSALCPGKRGCDWRAGELARLLVSSRSKPKWTWLRPRKSSLLRCRTWLRQADRKSTRLNYSH